MKIGLDFDGVISNCGELKACAAKIIYGLNIPSSKFNEKTIFEEGYLTKDQYKKLQQAAYGSWEIGMLMRPVEGVMEFLPDIAKEHSVTVITARGKPELEIAKKWSLKQGLELEFIGVENCSKKEAAKGLGFYVDDDPGNLESLEGIVPHLFLFSWGYNTDARLNTTVGRVSSWKEIHLNLQKLAGVR